MIDKKKIIQQEEKAVLVGLIQKEQTEQQVQEYLDELAFLAETAGAVAVKRFTQKLQHPDSRTFVGKGKLEEISNYVKGKDIRIVIFDDELSGAQITDSYRYLAESIRMHPDQDTLKAMMESANFSRVRYFNLTGGVVALHEGVKL